MTLCAISNGVLSALPSTSLESGQRLRQISKLAEAN
jgi:hypothetical protein